jgi:hypothetical protein
VRMVMSGFGAGDDWDDEVAALREGMAVALATLRLYLTHFAGRRPAVVDAGARWGGAQPAAWADLLAATGLAGARPGDRVALDGTPELAGTVEVLSPGRHRSDVLLLTSAPGAGIADLSTAGADAHAALHLSLFDLPDADVATLADRWRAWFREARR